MTFLELIEKVLKDAKKPLTADEIWNDAVFKGYDKDLKSKGKTPSRTVGSSIYRSLKDNPKTPFALKDKTLPKRYYLIKLEKQIDLTDTTIESEPTSSKKNIGYLEKDLHPFLSYYAYLHLSCYTKTINHLNSSKKGFGEWVHPDIVGCCFSHKDWESEVFELSSSIGNTSIKLFSFELKRELSLGNLRESFFQTVSNSTWANESYLVAAEIYEDVDFRKELSRLSTSFGIGVIKLDLESPHSSEIIFPAKNRKVLDWETINKLVEMNIDFKEFISIVKIDITSKNIHKKEYNPIIENLEAPTKKNN